MDIKTLFDKEFWLVFIPVLLALLTKDLILGM